jgi:hypothetical protein
MKKLKLFIITVVLFVNTNSYAGNIVFDLSENRSDYTALRSAFFPGWGQAYNKQPTKAWITFSLFAISLGGTIYFNNEADDKYNKYKHKGLIDDKLYDDYKNYENISKGFLISTAILYIFGITDAYFSFKRENNNLNLSAFNVYYNPDNDGMYVKYQHKI